MRHNYGSRIREGLALIVLLSVLVTGLSTTSSAATKYGVVTGSIRIYGGVEANPPAGSAISGRVVLKEAHGRALTIGVGKSGQFSVKLKPGVYTAFGGPPGWFPTCRGNDNRSFRVSPGETFKIVVACVAL